jgi:alkylation response protein AidB-like acyl-CoA dehydrogenase
MTGDFFAGVPDEAAATLAAAVALRPAILAARDQIEQERCLPPHLVRELKQAGVFRMTMPRNWGGTELDPLSQLRVLEEISYADGSVGWCATIGCDTGYFSAYMGQAAARDMFDVDMVTGGNLARTVGQARRVSGGYRVTGRWPFASGCRHADWMLASCLVYDDDVQAISADGVPITRVCFLPPGQCRIIDTWHTIGLRGTGSHDFSVADEFVPEEHSFDYQSLKPMRPEPLYAFPAFIAGKFGAVPLGVARAALDAAVELACRSHARPLIKGDKFIPRHPAIEEGFMQAGIAQAEAMIGSARSYLYDQTAQVWQHLVSGHRPSPADVGRYTLAYVNAYRTCREAVDQVYCLAGAAAIFSTSPLDRLLRDMHTMAQHVLAGPQSFEMAGRMLLGAEPVRMFI